MNQEYDFSKFLQAQEVDYAKALKEIQNGRKESHWIWYIFPQLKSLGRSHMALHFGIRDLNEARAYLSHPVLNMRLREITTALLMLPTNDPTSVMSYPDDLKLCSCMTLFMHATDDNEVFCSVIEKYFGGHADPNTLAEMNKDII